MSVVKISEVTLALWMSVRYHSE